MSENTTLTNLNLTTTDVGDLDTLAHRAPATNDLLALADWLASNGPTHLSAIERIELAERLITRRRFIIGAGGLLGAAALGACGAGEEAVTPTATTATTRTVTDVRGEIQIPANPQRMITLDAQSFETAVDLGIPVIATATFGNETWAHLGSNVLEGKDTIGTIGSPNLETIALIDPDLIVGANVLYGEGGSNSIADELSSIAPTFMYAESPNFGGGWREYYLELADVYNQRTLAEEQLRAYEQRVQTFKEAMGAERLTSFKTSIIDIRTDVIRFRGTDQVLGGSVMRDAGLQRPENQQTGNAHPISLEQLPEVDTDAIIVVTSDDEVFTQVEQSTIWQSLNAVRNGQVFRVPGRGPHWFAGTLPSALAVLNDLFTFFVRSE